MTASRVFKYIAGAAIVGTAGAGVATVSIAAKAISILDDVLTPINTPSDELVKDAITQILKIEKENPNLSCKITYIKNGFFIGCSNEHSRVHEKSYFVYSGESQKNNKL